MSPKAPPTAVQVPVQTGIDERWRWIFDPIPDWIRFDENLLRQFAHVEIDFAIKQMDLEKEKLVAVQAMMKR